MFGLILRFERQKLLGIERGMQNHYEQSHGHIEYYSYSCCYSILHIQLYHDYCHINHTTVYVYLCLSMFIYVYLYMFIFVYIALLFQIHCLYCDFGINHHFVGEVWHQQPPISFGLPSAPGAPAPRPIACLSRRR